LRLWIKRGAKGKLVTQNEVTLSTGEFDRRAHAMRSYGYPPGQTIRGAFGYVAP